MGVEEFFDYEIRAFFGRGFLEVRGHARPAFGIVVGGGGGFADEDFRLDALLGDCAVKLDEDFFHLRAFPSRAFLTVAVPVDLRLVDGADVGYVVAAVLEMFCDVRHVVCEFSVAVGLDVCLGVSGLSVALAVARPVNGRGVRKQQEFIAPVFLCLFHEILLACAFAPVVVSAVFCEERLFAVVEARDVRAVLFRRAAAEVHPPKRKPDAFGISVRAELLREQPFCDLPFLRVVEIASDKVSAPCVRGGEVVDCLVCFGSVYFNVQIFCVQHRRKRCRRNGEYCFSLHHIDFLFFCCVLYGVCAPQILRHANVLN